MLGLRSITNSSESMTMLEILQASFGSAFSVDMVVSFIKTSGVQLIENELRSIRQRNVPIRIITGTYLGITEPSALYRLKTILGDLGEIYLFSDHGISFHPKAYFFENSNGRSVFVGSSNLSRSALSDAVEWNYQIREQEDSAGYSHFRSQFEDILQNRAVVLDDQTLRKYAANWVKPAVDFDHPDQKRGVRVSYQDMDDPGKGPITVTRLIRPNDAQIEALYELSRLRAMGSDKALVAAATGIGKTYLAAFDSKASYLCGNIEA